jgi:hypothetical protein
MPRVTIVSSVTLAMAVVAMLLLPACDQRAPPTLELFRAVELGDLNQIKRHLRSGTDINQPDAAGDLPLHLAARMGKVGIVHELARHGADLSARDGAGRTAMELALLNGKTQVAEALIEDGAPLDPQASLVALVTAGVSDRDSVDLLMRQGADLNRPDAAGQPPLHQAVALGHLKTVQRLLQRGARVNQTDAQGMTPLTVAMGLDPRASDTASILATLIQFGAQPADGPAAAPDASPISNPGSTP